MGGGGTCLSTHFMIESTQLASRMYMLYSQHLAHFATNIKLSGEFIFSPESLGNGLDDPGFERPHRLLSPSQHPVGIGSFFRGVKRPGREVVYSPPPSIEVKNECCSAPSPRCMFSGRRQRQLLLFCVLPV
jgi:hypothetical protein